MWTAWTVLFIGLPLAALSYPQSGPGYLGGHHLNVHRRSPQASDAFALHQRRLHASLQGQNPNQGGAVSSQTFNSASDANLQRQALINAKEAAHAFRSSYQSGTSTSQVQGLIPSYARELEPTYSQQEVSAATPSPASAAAPETSPEGIIRSFYRQQAEFQPAKPSGDDDSLRAYQEQAAFAEQAALAFQQAIQQQAGAREQGQQPRIRLSQPQYVLEDQHSYVVPEPLKPVPAPGVKRVPAPAAPAAPEVREQPDHSEQYNLAAIQHAYQQIQTAQHQAAQDIQQGVHQPVEQIATAPQIHQGIPQSLAAARQRRPPTRPQVHPQATAPLSSSSEEAEIGLGLGLGDGDGFEFARQQPRVSTPAPQYVTRTSPARPKTVVQAAPEVQYQEIEIPQPKHVVQPLQYQELEPAPPPPKVHKGRTQSVRIEQPRVVQAEQPQLQQPVQIPTRGRIQYVHQASPSPAPVEYQYAAHQVTPTPAAPVRYLQATPTAQYESSPATQPQVKYLQATPTPTTAQVQYIPQQVTSPTTPPQIQYVKQPLAPQYQTTPYVAQPAPAPASNYQRTSPAQYTPTTKSQPSVYPKEAPVQYVEQQYTAVPSSAPTVPAPTTTVTKVGNIDLKLLRSLYAAAESLAKTQNDEIKPVSEDDLIKALLEQGKREQQAAEIIKQAAKTAPPAPKEEDIEVVHIPKPKNQRPITQEELQALISAGYDVRPVGDTKVAPTPALATEDPIRAQYLRQAEFLEKQAAFRSLRERGVELRRPHRAETDSVQPEEVSKSEDN